MTDAVPSMSQLIINFPLQYQENLGVFLWLECSIKCSLVDYTITLDLAEGIAKGVEFVVVLRNIKNPAQIGSTGNFQLQITYQ